MLSCYFLFFPSQSTLILFPEFLLLHLSLKSFEKQSHDYKGFRFLINNHCIAEDDFLFYFFKFSFSFLVETLRLIEDHQKYEDFDIKGYLIGNIWNLIRQLAVDSTFSVGPWAHACISKNHSPQSFFLCFSDSKI